MTKLEELQQDLIQIDTQRNTILKQIENSKKDIEWDELKEFEYLIGKCYKLDSDTHYKILSIEEIGSNDCLIGMVLRFSQIDVTVDPYNYIHTGSNEISLEEFESTYNKYVTNLLQIRL
jgi:hypothetical protein